jgi:beta-RFAP synthase
MIRVTAASRLHFGLFALPATGVAHWPNSEGQPALPARRFGGIGLMIDQPGVQVSARPADAWSASGPSSERALAVAQRFIALLPEHAERQFEIVVDRCAPEHAGLGVGTQLSLAVTRAVAIAAGHADWDAIELAQRTGRGLRSSIGIHGFQQGGFLVEGGKFGEDAVSPLLVRYPFPADWQVLLILPRGRQGTHGAEEREAFATLTQNERDLRRTEILSRVALLGLLPALLEQDLPAFGESLYEFNRRAGEWFLPWQGGVYASPAIEERIAWLRQHGIRGVGQSSWGPVMFAIERPEMLQHVRQRLFELGELHEDELLLCQAVNHGAVAH